jgi:hypothetical protein
MINGCATYLRRKGEEKEVIKIQQRTEPRIQIKTTNKRGNYRGERNGEIN